MDEATGQKQEKVNLCGGLTSVMCNLCQAIPGVNFVDVPDVILPSVDGEQASVGVVELKHSTD